MAGWLGGIALHLISGRRYYDVAARDALLAVGAYALSRLSAQTAKTGEIEAGRDERREAPLPGLQPKDCTGEGVADEHVAAIRGNVAGMKGAARRTPMGSPVS